MVAGKALGDGILGDVRRKLAAETCLLARKHSIRLEEQELAVLENKAARTAGKEAGKDAGESSGRTAGDRGGHRCSFWYM